MAITKSGVDRLGARLKGGEPSDEDLRALDAYRKSFEPSYESVVTAIRKDLKLEPTGRPAKSTTSVIDKLRRESIRLSQMQDIAGCRLIVQNVVEQDRIVRKLRRRFTNAMVTNRRTKPSHGYRAVHVIVMSLGKAIEIQVRTRLQHLWAEVSERLSDSVGTALKYGGGPADVRSSMDVASESVTAFEKLERALIALRQASDPRLSKLRNDLETLRRRNIKILEALSRVSQISSRSDDDFSD
jgi:putative GTP pyrophosphokinase